MVKRGRVAIIGPKDVEDVLVPEFSRKFSTVVFFTPESIKLSVGKTFSVTSGKFNLVHFDYVLLLPEENKSELYYILARMLEKKTKISVPSETLRYFWNRPMLMKKMSCEVPIRKMVSVSQNVASDFIKNEFKLPVVLTTPGNKRVYVSNEETLKNVLSLFSAGHMISVHKPVRNAEVHVTFMSERDAVGYYRTGEKRVPASLDSRLAELGQKARKILGVDFCSVLFVKVGKKYYVTNIKLLPNFDLFKKVLGKDLARIMAEETAYKISPTDVLGVIERAFKGIGKSFGSFSEWIGNEISNIRSAK